MSLDITPPSLGQSERNAADSAGGLPAGGFNALVPEFDVIDIGRSLNFWCDLLGFRIAYDRKAANFAYLEREGAQVMLSQINGAWVTAPLEPPLGRGINFQIAVSDISDIAARLEAAAWPLFRGVQDAVYNVGGRDVVSRELLVQDPDGYLVRLAQSLPPGELPRASAP
ncbi:bleomycin resistance protein [Rhizobium sp. Leaf341]|uniref:bleomycin resistance protein n=1 Tax=Rhizobium sp. Leaf341 TaxID=1736344 RepID=UPI000AED0D48|nr:VOC family protein [Rhizobium sp. Leaf341]